jgi:hypothetical protein
MLINEVQGFVQINKMLFDNTKYSANIAHQNKYIPTILNKKRKNEEDIDRTLADGRAFSLQLYRKQFQQTNRNKDCQGQG